MHTVSVSHDVPRQLLYHLLSHVEFRCLWPLIEHQYLGVLHGRLRGPYSSEGLRANHARGQVVTGPCHRVEDSGRAAVAEGSAGLQGPVRCWCENENGALATSIWRMVKSNAKIMAKTRKLPLYSPPPGKRIVNLL